MNGPPQRMALFYAAIFAAIGIQLPYFPVWLQAKGLSAPQIGTLLAFTFLGKVIINPLVGSLVDRRGNRRRIMVTLAAATVLATLTLALADGFFALAILTFLAMGLMAGMLPVADNLTLGLARSRGFDYGRVRLWGSLAFIATANIGGALLGWFSAEVIIWLFIAGLVLTLMACLKLPEVETAPSHSSPVPLRALLGNPVYLTFLAACCLIQISHTTYYGFATLHWRASGIEDWIIGLLWAEGVMAEIALFAVGPAVVARLGPCGLLLAAGIGCVVRWSLLAVSTSVPLLVVGQVLHAATFGCTHLGAMHFIHRAAPPAIAVRAQSVYASVTVGLAPGLAAFASGPLYERLSGQAFVVMAIAAVAATTLALRLRRRWHGEALPL